MTRSLPLLIAALAACSSDSTANPSAPAQASAPAPTPKAAPAPASPPAPKAAATSPSAPEDWAPSTGNEMPKAAKPELDKRALEQQLAKGVELATKARAAKDKAGCSRAVSLLYPAAVGLALAPTKKTAPVFELLASCARASQRYQVLEVVARTVAKTPIGRSSDLAFALLGQDRRADAKAELATRLRATPDDPALLALAARLACLDRDFAKCRTVAQRALASKAKHADATVGKAQAHVMLWNAGLMLGDYQGARAAIAAMPSEMPRDALTKLLVPAERAKLGVDVKRSRQLALGTYHLAGSVNPPVIEITLGNGDRQERELRVEVEIPGVTTRAVRSTVLLGKGSEHVTLTPPLLPTFAVADVRAPRQAQLDLRVTEGGKVVYEQSYPTELLPRDYLPTWHKVSEDTKRPTLHNLGAWVTPNDPAIETFLGAAKQRLVGKQSFSGPQSPSLPQVQAIYDELKARGVSYVMDPAVSSDQFIGQRTRLPSEVLASTNAQCLEGTLLFASLLEAIGLAPVIVTVPGHAFIGWRTNPKDGKAPPMYFVETTMVHTGTFESAVKVATRRVEAELKQGTFKKGASRLIEVTALRAKGITAQPTR